MKDSNDRRVVIIGLVSFLALVLSLLHRWWAFGTAIGLLIVLLLGVGFGRETSRKPIVVGLVGVLAAYLVFWGAILWTHDPTEEATLLFGIPLSTAFLVYGLWPLGLAVGVLYFVVFQHAVLPPQKLEKFLAVFGRRE